MNLRFVGHGIDIEQYLACQEGIITHLKFAVPVGIPERLFGEVGNS